MAKTPAKPRASVKRSKPTPEQQVVEREKIIEKTYLVDTSKLEEQVRQSREGTALNPTPADVFLAAQKLVESEKQKYEDASFNIRETLKRAYKNYLGIFDQPYDQNTGRKKIFTPLTHNIVDSISKPVSIEPEAIKIKPITEESRGNARVIDMVMPYFYTEMGLRELYKKFTLYLALFGTQVTVKDWYYEEVEVSDEADPTVQVLLTEGFARKEKTKDKTRIVKTDRPRIRLVNVLDLYVPFTAESLAWACKNASVILRSVQTVDQIQANPIYDDESKALLRGTTFSRNDTRNSDALDQYNTAAYLGRNPTAKTGGWQDFFRQERPIVDIFERYGMVPKSWITLKAEDALQFVPAIITCASDSSGGTMRTLSVRLSPFGAEGPFEEAWFNKLPNRWYGEGLGERLTPLQIWHNEIVNTRRNNEMLTQNRMFIYKKGSVNPNDFRARPAGGIGVQNMTDVTPLNMPDVASSSFQEDAYLEGAAQRLAGAAMTPIQKKATATEVENIQANSNLTYNELRENMEDYLSRVFNRHIIPLMKKFFTGNITVPISLPDSTLKMLDTLNGYEPFVSDQLGRERFLLIQDGQIFDGKYAVIADIEALGGSRASKIQALTNAIAMASKIQNSKLNITNAFRKLMELTGIVDERLFEDAEMPMASGVRMGAMPAVEEPQPIAPQPVGVQ